MPCTMAPMSAPRTGVVALALVVFSIAIAGTPGCKRSKHARVSSFTPPPLPAGFAAQSGTGWRIAVPTTWKPAPQRPPATWATADPQAVDDYHANANVVTEPFVGDSYDFARANEEGLREQKQATVEAAREDVVDGDPTLVLESRWAATPPSTVSYRTMQTALASRGTGYVITCAVSANAFERYRSTCESIVRSFAVER
jgi:hypothetical protein